MNVNLANGWGIVRTIVDLVMKQGEGKFCLIRDPNSVGYTRTSLLCRVLTDSDLHSPSSACTRFPSMHLSRSMRRTKSRYSLATSRTLASCRGLGMSPFLREKGSCARLRCKSLLTASEATDTALSPAAVHRQQISSRVCGIGCLVFAPLAIYRGLT